MEIFGENSLILVGAWNPAILSPSWMGREVFDIPAGTEIPVQMEFASVPGAVPRVTIQGISYVPAQDRLSFYINELTLERLETIENYLSRILEILPHTPIRAFGENFEFLEKEPSPDQLRIFELQGNRIQELDFIRDLHSVNIKQSFVLDDCILNLNQILQDGALTIKFNFHYEVENANEARGKLANTFSRNLRRAASFLDICGDIPESLAWALEIGEPRQ